MLENARPGRNYHAIDITKFIMAICVVAIHTWGTPDCPLPLEKLYGCVVNCAVPFFFLASGFFLGEKVNRADSASHQTIILKNLIRFIKLYSIWYIIYLPLAISYFYANDYSVIKSILVSVRGYLLIGKNFYSDMLWYLLSTIYALFFLLVLLKLRLQMRHIVFCGIGCHMVGILITAFTGYDGDLPHLLSVLQRLLGLTIDNGRLLTGFSYIPLGMLLAQKNLRCSTGLILAITGFAGNYLWDGALGTVMLAVCCVGIFVIASRIQLPDFPVYRYFRKSSTVIYFIHQFVWAIYCFAVYKQDVQNLHVFLIVLSICAVLSAIWLFIPTIHNRHKQTTVS